MAESLLVRKGGGGSSVFQDKVDYTVANGYSIKKGDLIEIVYPGVTWDFTNYDTKTALESQVHIKAAYEIKRINKNKVLIFYQEIISSIPYLYYKVITKVGKSLVYSSGVSTGIELRENQQGQKTYFSFDMYDDKYGVIAYGERTDSNLMYRFFKIENDVVTLGSQNVFNELENSITTLNVIRVSAAKLTRPIDNFTNHFRTRIAMIYVYNGTAVRTRFGWVRLTNDSTLSGSKDTATLNDATNKYGQSERYFRSFLDYNGLDPATGYHTWYQVGVNFSPAAGKSSFIYYLSTNTNSFFDTLTSAYSDNISTNSAVKGFMHRYNFGLFTYTNTTPQEKLYGFELTANNSTYAVNSTGDQSVNSLSVEFLLKDFDSYVKVKRLTDGSIQINKSTIRPISQTISNTTSPSTVLTSISSGTIYHIDTINFDDETFAIFYGNSSTGKLTSSLFGVSNIKVKPYHNELNRLNKIIGYAEKNAESNTTVEITLI
jgi:hypothetical protein